MPSLFVLVVFRSLDARPKKDRILFSLWGDEPCVCVEDIHGGKVERALNVGDPVGADEMADITVVPAHHGGLDLNAKTTAVMFDDEVVGGGLSPRFTDVQTFFGGACHEAHLYPFAALLGCFEILDWISHGFGPQNKKSAAMAALLRLSDCYIQSIRLNRVIVPCFGSLYLGCNQPLGENGGRKGY